jgi:hypothetical protein
MNFGYRSTFQSIDKGLIEKIGPTGFVVTIFNASSNFVSFSTGYPYKAIYVLIFFTFVFISIYFTFTFGLVSSMSISFILLVFSFLIRFLLSQELEV